MNSLTGKRLKLLEGMLSKTFMLTTVMDYQILILKNYIIFIRKIKDITVTAVHPPARFGELEIKSLVKKFKEKPQL